MTALGVPSADLATTILDELDAGRRRAAVPDLDAPGGWRAEPEVKAAILARFRDRATATWDLEERSRSGTGSACRPSACSMVPRPARRSTTAGRGGSSPAERASVPASTWVPAS